jgi:hypothetical protein
MLRSFVLASAAVACAGIAVAIALNAGCISAPPPDLPVPVLQRPTILHDAVEPPETEILTTLPSEFIVPVLLASPDETFQWDAFVDYQPCTGLDCPSETSPYVGPTTVTPTPGTLDGGVYLAHFDPPPAVLVDPTQCNHTIQFLVAHAFNGPNALHTPDSIGGDIVTWNYSPGGSTTSCVFDAGALQDGAFPPADAATDGVPVVPESGGGDP